MTLDCKKMFLTVTEEAAVKGHFAQAVNADNALRTAADKSLPCSTPDPELLCTRAGAFLL